MGKVRTIAGDPLPSPHSIVGQRNLGVDISKGEELGALNREIAAEQVEWSLSKEDIPAPTLQGIKLRFPK